jgi:hypothetical protein
MTMLTTACHVEPLLFPGPTCDTRLSLLLRMVTVGSWV